jgi:hypothetical protein
LSISDRKLAFILKENKWEEKKKKVEKQKFCTLP